MIEKLEIIEKRYQEIDRQMAKPEVATDLNQLQVLAQERASLENLVTNYREYKAIISSLEETRAMLDDGLDEEIAALAKQEIEILELRLDSVERVLKTAMNMAPARVRVIKVKPRRDLLRKVFRRESRTGGVIFFNRAKTHAILVDGSSSASPCW